MEITRKYVEFILEYMGNEQRVQLMEPQEDGRHISWKTGPTISTTVKIEVLNKYTRSAQLRLSFDKYIVEELFFMPMNSSPDSIINKTHNRVHKIVNKTFIEDGRADDLKKLYAEKRAFINEMFIKAKEKNNEQTR